MHLYIFLSPSYSLSICQGPYDAALVNAWEEWDSKHGSENDHPKEFPENQVAYNMIFQN